MPTALLLVLTRNTDPSRLDEFNAWYDGHVHDVMKVHPGFVAATRYQAASLQVGGVEAPYSHLALYEIETDDLPDLLSAAQEARADIFVSPLLDREHALGILFEPAGTRARRLGKDPEQDLADK